MGRVIVISAVLGLIDYKIATLIMLWLLRINILEACLFDFLNGSRMNATFGAVVLAGTFSIELRWIDVYYVMSSPILLIWIIAYTVWHFAFMSKNFPQAVAVFHITVLAAPLLQGLLTRDLGFWLALRGVSLTIAGAFQLMRPEELSRWFEIPIKSDEKT